MPQCHVVAIKVRQSDHLGAEGNDVRDYESKRRDLQRLHSNKCVVREQEFVDESFGLSVSGTPSRAVNTQQNQFDETEWEVLKRLAIGEQFEGALCLDSFGELTLDCCYLNQSGDAVFALAIVETGNKFTLMIRKSDWPQEEIDPNRYPAVSWLKDAKSVVVLDYIAETLTEFVSLTNFTKVRDGTRLLLRKCGDSVEF